MQLINCTADAVCEEQHIALEPGDGLGWVFEAGAGAAHAGGVLKVYSWMNIGRIGSASWQCCVCEWRPMYEGRDIGAGER